jgi:hypothetical protein
MLLKLKSWENNYFSFYGWNLKWKSGYNSAPKITDDSETKTKNLFFGSGTFYVWFWRLIFRQLSDCIHQGSSVTPSPCVEARPTPALSLISFLGQGERILWSLHWSSFELVREPGFTCRGLPRSLNKDVAHVTWTWTQTWTQFNLNTNLNTWIVVTVRENYGRFQFL